MPCLKLSGYLAARCMVPDCVNPAEHTYNRGSAPVHDIQIYCGDHCPVHAPAPPKEWPKEAPKSLTAEQRGLFK